MAFNCFDRGTVVARHLAIGPDRERPKEGAMKNPVLLSTAISILALPPLASATDLHAWNNHASPLTFLFGNEIDGHQQSSAQENGGLFGFLYVHFTGTITKDGHRVATHVDCGSVPDCSVGWVMFGKARTATFLYQEMDDHPVFLIPRRDLPQPGAYSHFHRVGHDVQSSGPGYILDLVAIDSFCFIHHDAESASATKTCVENKGVPVSPGIDASTHLNVVTSFPAGGGQPM